MRRYALLLAALATACGPDTGQPSGGRPACTEIAVAGLNVDVVDSLTQRPLCDASVTARDGDYSERLEMSTGSEDCTFFGAFERSGSYTVTATAPEHVTRTVDKLLVTADVCHVVPVVRRIPLDPM